MTPETPAELAHRTLQLPPSPGVPGGPVQYADLGEGPAIVLVHGYPGRPADFRWMVPLLDGFRVVAVAMPGLDFTPLATCPAATLEGRAAFVTAFLDALDLRGTVVGHSMSAGVLLHTAVARPERVARLGLLAPIGLRPHVGVRRSFPSLGYAFTQIRALQWASRPLMRWAFPAMGFPKSLSDPAMLHALHCAASLDFAGQRAVAARVIVPCLLAWAEDDHLVEPAIPAELGERLPDGPRLSWSTGGHGIVKSRAVEIAGALRAFAAP